MVSFTTKSRHVEIVGASEIAEQPFLDKDLIQIEPNLDIDGTEIGNYIVTLAVKFKPYEQIIVTFIEHEDRSDCGNACISYY